MTLILFFPDGSNKKLTNVESFYPYGYTHNPPLKNSYMVVLKEKGCIQEDNVETFLIREPLTPEI